jgi:hypothetical protein
MAWNSNNRAHTSLWGFEIWDHDDEDAGFEEVGSWGTDYIVKSSPGDSAEMRAEKARTHAEKLDGAFVSLFRAGYEDGQDRGSATDSMTEILGDSNNTMSDLADVVDDKYKFLGEG